MHGGEEVSAIVLDVGMSTIKAGWAGEDAPKAMFSSYVGVGPAKERAPAAVGAMDVIEPASNAPTPPVAADKSYYCGTNALSIRRDHVEIVHPLKQGVVSRWEEYEQLLQHTFRGTLNANVNEHQVLLAEPVYNPRTAREKTTELMFERFRVPALFIAKSPVLSSFAVGRATSVVVDSGAAGTLAVAVLDGYCLIKGIQRSSAGGEKLSADLRRLIIEGKHVELRPPFSVQKKEIRGGRFEVLTRNFPNTTASYTDFSIRSIVDDVKESLLKVSDTPYIEEAFANIAPLSYELPDGKTLDLGGERFRLTEQLFSAALAGTEPTGEAILPVQQLVLKVVQQCDADLRKDLFAGLVVTGGNSLMSGFAERLQKELADLSAYKCKLVQTAGIERRCGTWIGGSILGSLGSFQQMWMSKQEYDEHGKSLVERKCP